MCGNMKVGKYVWVVLALFVGKEASSQILKNNIRPDVIVIDRRSDVDSLFASEVISKYYATLEKGFSSSRVASVYYCGP